MIRVVSFVLVLVPVLSCLAPPATAQLIDFEQLPGGAPTADQQTISTEYAAYGVSFTLVDRVTGQPSGSPLIAKVGAPQTAFEGCTGADTPRPGQDLGQSFLTDGSSLGVQGDLLVEYDNAVAQASGVILDIDCRNNGGAPCEQWTLHAFDASGAVLDSLVLDGPEGPVNPECLSPHAGPGDALAFGWSFDVGSPLIRSILLRYTGSASNVGLAFDNFSVASLPGPLLAFASTPVDTICPGEQIPLEASASQGVPPYQFQWEVESGPGQWSPLGTGTTQQVQPTSTTRYRVVVTDADSTQVASDPVTLVAAADDPLCQGQLLISSHYTDSILGYSFRSGRLSTFVPTGSGGLNSPSKLVCGPDGNLYVSSQADHAVRRYDGVDGSFLDVFVPNGSGGLNTPVGLDFGPDGNLYVVSNGNHQVLRYDGSSGAFVDVFVPNGSGLNSPSGLVWGDDGRMYVCSVNSDKVLHFAADGTALGDFVSAGSGGLNGPRGLVFGPDGHLYVGEQYNNAVRRYDGLTGAFLDLFVPGGTGGLDRANDVAFGLDGRLWVASFDNDLLLGYDAGSGTHERSVVDASLMDGPAWLHASCANSATSVQPGPGAASGFAFRVTQAGGRVGLAFELAREAPVRLVLHDLRGRQVVTLVDGWLAAGDHQLEWAGRDAHGASVARGVYLARLRVGDKAEVVRSVVLLR